MTPSIGSCPDLGDKIVIAVTWQEDSCWGEVRQSRVHESDLPALQFPPLLFQTDLTGLTMSQFYDVAEQYDLLFDMSDPCYLDERGHLQTGYPRLRFNPSIPLRQADQAVDFLMALRHFRKTS